MLTQSPDSLRPYKVDKFDIKDLGSKQVDGRDFYRNILNSSSRIEMLEATEKLIKKIKNTKSSTTDENLLNELNILFPEILLQYSKVSNIGELETYKDFLSKLYSATERSTWKEEKLFKSWEEKDILFFKYFLIRNLNLFCLFPEYSPENVIDELAIHERHKSSKGSPNTFMQLRLDALNIIKLKSQRRLLEDSFRPKISEREVNKFLTRFSESSDLKLSDESKKLMERYCKIAGNLPIFSQKDQIYNNLFEILERALDDESLSQCINEADKFLGHMLKLRCQVETSDNFPIEIEFKDKRKLLESDKLKPLISFKSRVEDAMRNCKSLLSNLNPQVFLATMWIIVLPVGFINMIPSKTSWNSSGNPLGPIHSNDLGNLQDSLSTLEEIHIKVEATWAGDERQNHITASGQIFDRHRATLAIHNSLAEEYGIEMGSTVTLSTLRGDRSVEVEVNDHGPEKLHQVIISETAAKTLEIDDDGVAKVNLEIVPPND